MSTTTAALDYIAADLRALARPIGELREDPKNARQHPDPNLAAIEASLRAHGQRKPIVVKDGLVIAGNGTLRVARRLGWAAIAAVEYEGPEALARAYAIADNRAGEGAEWDGELLAEALRTAESAGVLDATAFDKASADARIAEALADAAVEVEDPGAEEPPITPASKRGEIYELGPHRLLCGDSTNAGDVALLMAGAKAALCATDPPYIVGYTGERANDSGKDWSDSYHETEIDDAEQFFAAAFGNALAATEERAAFYCWHGHKRYPLITKVWAELGLLLHQQIVWVKPSPVFGSSYYHYRHEQCVLGWRKGKKPPHDGDHSIDSVWECDWEGKARVVGNEHPTEKPLELFRRPIRKHTQPNDIVFEPFSGSGSQLIAAAQLGRRCFAIEIEPGFCDVARRRWTKWSTAAGQDPGKGGLK